MTASDVTVKIEFPLADAHDVIVKEIDRLKKEGNEDVLPMFEELKDKLDAAINKTIDLQVKLARKQISKNLNDEN